ncbi:MAG: histidine kinase [Bacteroidota bacterium]
MIILKNQKYRLALILSPLIALYGFAPIYIFTEIDIAESVVSYIGLAIMIFIFWLANIGLFETKMSTSLKYAVSYSSILASQVISFFILPFSYYFANNPNSYYLYIILSTVVCNSIILLLMHAIALNQAKITTEKELGELRLQHSEAQIKNLLQQLQPHFLFNTLSILKSLISENPSEAEDYTVRLSEFLRYSVQSSSRELVTLTEELDFVKDFLALQEKRFGNSMTYSIELPQHLMSTRIPIFALQTLVENAMKHNRFTEKKTLHIEIKFENGRVRVSNNKLPKAIKRPSGTGLANLNQRYQLTLGKSLEIIETDREFTVFIELLAA